MTTVNIIAVYMNSSGLNVFSLKLLLNQIAVSLGETFPGPNGFNRTPSSSYLACCSNLALNSSSPSKASALCWNDDGSNCRRRKSEDVWLEAPAVAFWSEEPLLSSSISFNTLCLIPCQESVQSGLFEALSCTSTVHLSITVEWLPLEGRPEEPWAKDDVLLMGNKESTYEVNGNSAILSIRGELTEISGEDTWLIIVALGPQGGCRIPPLVGNGNDALRLVLADFVVLCESGICNQTLASQPCNIFFRDLPWGLTKYKDALSYSWILQSTLIAFFLFLFYDFVIIPVKERI